MRKWNVEVMIGADIVILYAIVLPLFIEHVVWRVFACVCVCCSGGRWTSVQVFARTQPPFTAMKVQSGNFAAVIVCTLVVVSVDVEVLAPTRHCNRTISSPSLHANSQAQLEIHYRRIGEQFYMKKQQKFLNFYSFTYLCTYVHMYLCTYAYMYKQCKAIACRSEWQLDLSLSPGCGGEMYLSEDEDDTSILPLARLSNWSPLSAQMAEYKTIRWFEWLPVWLTDRPTNCAVVNNGPGICMLFTNTGTTGDAAITKRAMHPLHPATTSKAAKSTKKKWHAKTNVSENIKRVCNKCNKTVYQSLLNATVTNKTILREYLSKFLEYREQLTTKEQRGAAKQQEHATLQSCKCIVWLR